MFLRHHPRKREVVVREETHARTLWNKLEQLYARKTGNNKLFLIKQMIEIKVLDGDPLFTDHLNVFQGIINQLAGMGIKFEDEIQGLWLLGTLPDTWETFRTSLSNSAPDGVITMELAKGSILNKEMRRKSQGSSSHSDVLITERQGRSKSRGPSNRGNHRSSSSKGKFADVECYHCHKKGHTMKFCRHNYTTDWSSLFVQNYDMVNLAHDDSSWILDIGATYLFEFDTWMELVLHNVKHVPDMRLNIISTGLLDEDGYHKCSGNGLWKVTLGSLIVCKGKGIQVLHEKSEDLNEHFERQTRKKQNVFKVHNGGEYIGPLTRNVESMKFNIKDSTESRQLNGLDRSYTMKSIWKQPEGFQVKGKEDYVCRLQKSLYRLKQAPRQWYKKFESVIEKQGFQKTFSDHCVFFKRFGDDDFIILLLYTWGSKTNLGISDFPDRGCQEVAYFTRANTLRSAAAGLTWIKAKVVSSPLTPNFKLTDRRCPSLRRYYNKMVECHMPQRTSKFAAITFGNGKPMLVGYTDSDLAGNKDNMKSTSGYLMTFAGEAVSWQSMYYSPLHLKNSLFHKRTKHIDYPVSLIRDAFEDGMFELNKLIWDDNACDMLTKAVARGNS
ncbi:putative RNA-directed DNA polymerase [Tanacetum coccineum]